MRYGYRMTTHAAVPGDTPEPGDTTEADGPRPRAAVVVVSTLIARGEEGDRSGPLLVDWLRGSGYECPAPRVAEDGGPVGAVLRELLGLSAHDRPGAHLDGGHAGTGLDGGSPAAASAAVARADRQVPDLIVTSGGTGLNPADRTPEETDALLEVRAPGIMHALWAKGLTSTPSAVMSRGVAGARGATFLVNLPGSTGGVRDGIAVLTPLLPHIRHQLGDCDG